jgi:hypothetical protein
VADSQIVISQGEFVHEKARDAAENGEKLYDGSICSACSSTRWSGTATAKSVWTAEPPPAVHKPFLLLHKKQVSRG